MPNEADLVIRTLAVRYSSGYRLEPHDHEWAQLVYATSGVMGVDTAEGTWVVPTHRAVWVPPGVEHSIEMCGSVAMRSLYVAPVVTGALPSECRVIHVSPLLRELILHAISIGMLDRSVPEQSRLVGVILDQIDVTAELPLRLPQPRDHRARRLAERVAADPRDQRGVEDLAGGTGASKRTIERLFLSETGMTFGKWRQQFRLLHALRRLAAGESVTSVAFEVGYDSPSAFIAMFKRHLGTTPSRYYSESVK